MNCLCLCCSQEEKVRQGWCFLFVPNMTSTSIHVHAGSSKLIMCCVQNQNSPRRSKSLKHKNGESVCLHGRRRGDRMKLWLLELVTNSFTVEMEAFRVAARGRKRKTRRAQGLNRQLICLISLLWTIRIRDSSPTGAPVSSVEITNSSST